MSGTLLQCLGAWAAHSPPARWAVQAAGSQTQECRLRTCVRTRAALGTTLGPAAQPCRAQPRQAGPGRRLQPALTASAAPQPQRATATQKRPALRGRAASPKPPLQQGRRCSRPPRPTRMWTLPASCRHALDAAAGAVLQPLCSPSSRQLGRPWQVNKLRRQVLCHCSVLTDVPLLCRRWAWRRRAPAGRSRQLRGLPGCQAPLRQAPLARLPTTPPLPAHSQGPNSCRTRQIPALCGTCAWDQAVHARLCC